MNRTGICPKCGGNQIAGPHRLHGHQHVSLDLPGVLTATLEAYTCADCGYTELYSDRMGLRNVRSQGRFMTSRQQPTPKICPICATKVHPNADSCPECGYQLN